LYCVKQVSCEKISQFGLLIGHCSKTQSMSFANYGPRLTLVELLSSKLNAKNK